ncbi:MAG: hypothetical protein Q8L97_03790 [Nitrosomonas sp.]|uniref:hypothetical protein n=1 Tax=Nitrosomonas sp. TaxID=42353 RepID=UPI0027310C7B|nr:hypothetical protein [Nitrosomonas sp.]MDP1549269.1 hypothetical protein [Nitrosomonas sp.]
MLFVGAFQRNEVVFEANSTTKNLDVAKAALDRALERLEVCISDEINANRSKNAFD